MIASGLNVKASVGFRRPEHRKTTRLKRVQMVGSAGGSGSRRKSRIMMRKLESGHQMPPPEKMMFQLTLRRRGISDQAVLRAMEDVPREAFVEEGDRQNAYRDSALGIACGQTISQPFVVAYMTEQLQLQK